MIAKAEISTVYLETLVNPQGFLFGHVHMYIPDITLALTPACVYTHRWCVRPLHMCVPTGNTFSWGMGLQQSHGTLAVISGMIYFPLTTYIKDIVGKTQNSSMTYTQGGICAANAFSV